MNIGYHTLHWDNVDSRILESHQSVMNHFGIDVQYMNMNIDHGTWMTSIIRNTNSDVYVFFDVDCVPLNKEVVDYSINYAIQNESFIGASQVSNHIFPYTHVFVAPCFFVISKKCYELLGKPSFFPTMRSDVAEEVSYVAEECGKRYKCFYPTKFDGIPKKDGVWRLSNYGYYGIGTLYDNKIYHLFESRWGDHIELFQKRCNQILKGEFDSSSMYDSKEEFYGKKVS
jgi:hypothetical protein